MAERRMFAKSIVLSDSFLDMPMSARCLYFTFGMLADDDGFIGSPKAIMRQCGATEDDLKILLAKRYVLGFESGIIVIKHWRMNNYLRTDRYTETTYLEEKNELTIDQKGAYTEVGIPGGRQVVYQVATQDSIGKNSIDKNSIDNNIPTSEEEKSKKHKYGEYGHVLLADEEFAKLHNDYSNADGLITFLDEYIEMKGYKAKSHYLAIKKWVVDAVSKNQKQTKPTFNQPLEYPKEPRPSSNTQLGEYKWNVAKPMSREEIEEELEKARKIREGQYEEN